MLRRAFAFALTGAVAALAAAAPPAGASKPPSIDQLVAFRDGSALQSTVRAKSTHVDVGSRRCAVASGTALAALARTKPPKLKLHDYGSCSKKHARDAVSLFVYGIGPDTNAGVDGWVYKVGNRLATAGAADPSGPFGNGRLHAGARVTWFYCHMNVAKHSCQRTLRVKAQPAPAGTLRVHVSSYDDRGKSKPGAGATVHAGDAVATADANGDATLLLPAGTYAVRAERSGAIRSFEETVGVG